MTKVKMAPGVEVVTHYVRTDGPVEPIVPKVKEVAAVGKKLHISLVDRSAPTYHFIGEWAGRDIMVVARTIVRAYRKEQLAKRHAGQPVISESNGNQVFAQPQGATHG